MKLYFIALVPDEELREHILSKKEEFSARYGARHALKLPAHITLQPPVKLSEADEEALVVALKNFNKEHEPIEIELDGFGAFPPRVIYVKIANPIEVMAFQRELQAFLQTFLPEKADRGPGFHPHITIATLDLTHKSFKAAWPVYKELPFKARFTAKSLFIFKHNGKNWEIFRELSFKEHEE